MEAAHSLGYIATFGDCDPAGIVYYPRLFGLFDRTFHDWIRRFGGHGAVCERLGSRGLGLMSARAEFRSPAHDGDALTIALAVGAWSARSVTLDYEIRCESRLVATGTEVRGLFRASASGMVAGDVAPLRKIVDGG